VRRGGNHGYSVEFNLPVVAETMTGQEYNEAMRCPRIGSERFSGTATVRDKSGSGSIDSMLSPEVPSLSKRQNKQ
jgi:hypothetical protein